MAIKILVAGQKEVFWRGLVEILNERPDFFELVAVCSEASEAIEKSVELNPDIVMLDEWLVDVSMDIVRTLRERLPKMRIILVISPRKESDISQILTTEANAYVDKDVGEDLLGRIISYVYQGNAHVSPRIARKLLKIARQPYEVMAGTQSGGDIHLSIRETDILKLVAKGEGNKEIATELCITVNTVKGHLSSIIHKMHVGNRVQAINLARKKGILV